MLSSGTEQKEKDFMGKYSGGLIRVQKSKSGHCASKANLIAAIIKLC